MESNAVVNDNKLMSPYVVFKIQDELYCLDSWYVSNIMELPKYETVAKVPPYITGIFTYREQVIHMLDLRILFEKKTLEEEYQEFSNMLEQRKQDHIDWVKELDRCLKAGESFKLATDPHKCAFGKWYDHYTCNNNVVMYHLKQIDEPHRKLHQAAVEASQCDKNCSSCKREECLEKILNRAKEEYMPVILKLLEESKEIFRNTVYHEKVIVLNGENHVGLVVDEVISVGMMGRLGSMEAMNRFQNFSYISGINMMEGQEKMILEVDLEKILALSVE